MNDFYADFYFDWTSLRRSFPLETGSFLHILYLRYPNQSSSTDGLDFFYLKRKKKKKHRTDV